MNLNNVVISRVTQPIPDWNIKADITDDVGNVLSTFGVDGTSVNDWWNNQSEEFQLEYVGIFMSVMAVQIAGTD
jgi:hypothetical protein